MKPIILLAFILSGTCAWAEIIGYTWYGSSFVPKDVVTSGGGGEITPIETQVVSTNPLVFHMQPHVWEVGKGTESYTLNEFVSSGKFCEWRGRHEWVTNFETDYRYKCIICERYRLGHFYRILLRNGSHVGWGISIGYCFGAAFFYFLFKWCVFKK